MEKCVECSNCQSPYGKLVNVRDGGKAEWQCRDCKAVQPWVDEPHPQITCGCVRCLDELPPLPNWPFKRSRQFMVLCQKCGNKRCPHAEWHEYECTGSNEPNQTPVRTAGLRPAKLADLAKRPAWIEAAARECCKHLPAPWGAPCERSIFADVIEKHWRRAQ